MRQYNPISPNSGRKNGKYSRKHVNNAVRLIKKLYFKFKYHLYNNCFIFMNIFKIYL